MKSITFTGISSGDMECFCWKVTKEEFVKITRREPDKFDSVEDWAGEVSGKGLYRIYPDHIFESLDIKDKKPLKFTITVE